LVFAPDRRSMRAFAWFLACKTAINDLLKITQPGAIELLCRLCVAR
jgi:hypothetical protein